MRIADSGMLQKSRRRFQTRYSTSRRRAESELMLRDWNSSCSSLLLSLSSCSSRSAWALKLSSLLQLCSSSRCLFNLRRTCYSSSACSFCRRSSSSACSSACTSALILSASRAAISRSILDLRMMLSLAISSSALDSLTLSSMMRSTCVASQMRLEQLQGDGCLPLRLEDIFLAILIIKAIIASKTVVGRAVGWRFCIRQQNQGRSLQIMYSQSVLFKNSRLNHLQHSQSERLLSGSGVPLVRKHSGNNFRKRSLKTRNIGFNEQQHARSPQPQSTLEEPPRKSSELHFLTELLRKKQESVSVRQLEEPFSRRPSRDYEYYDMIVRDLIEEIKGRTTKDFSSSPQRAIKAIEISKGSPHKRREVEYGSIKLTSNRQAMRFSLSHNGADTVYQKKITSYVEFLYKLNFCNRMYVDLSLSQPKLTYKVKVGTGNNGLLVKSLLKRRFWLEITSGSDFSFSWTQQTNSEIHEQQASFQPSQAKTRLKPPNRTKLLANSAYELQEKIMYRGQISAANEWYERSDCGKISCFPQATITKVTNHIPLNCIIGAKRILFKVISWYYSEILEVDPFTVLPRTVSIDNALCVKTFIETHKASKKVWIVKPGENTNRGNGIKIVETAALMALLSRQRSRGPELRPLIVQEYIKPFLYNGRKFDIRHYLLVTCHNGNLRGYWYREGYIRTSSEKYDLEDMDEMIHLTNDAIQKRGERYGRYEPANKLSYSQFQRYLDSAFPHKHYQLDAVLSRMKEITTNMLRAAFQFIDPQRRHHNFELYGLDFYISSKFKPYLIECNANPCLEINCPILERIIPGAVQHALRIGLDPLFPPPQHYPLATRYHLCDRIMEKLKYELIFDEKAQGSAIREKTAKCARKLNLEGVRLRPQEDEFEDQGEELCEEAALD